MILYGDQLQAAL